MSCNTCHKTDAPLRKCAKCGNAAYCSLECQRQDWRSGHKNVCGVTNTTDTYQQLSASAKAGDKAEMMKLMQQLLSKKATQAEHGHSHGGKPCHGHGQEEEDEEDHGHAHGGRGHGHEHGHGGGHGHGGPPQHVGPTTVYAQPQQQHGHSHGGKPCHGHGTEAEENHGHSHGGHDDEDVDAHQHGYARQRARLAEKARSKHAHDGGHGHSHGGKPCHGHGTEASDNHGHAHSAGSGHGHSHGGVACDGHHDEQDDAVSFYRDELRRIQVYHPLIHIENKDTTSPSDIKSYSHPSLIPVESTITSPFTAALSELQIGSTHFSAATDTPTIYHLTYESTATALSLIPTRSTLLRLVPDVTSLNDKEDEPVSPFDVDGMQQHIRMGDCHLCRQQNLPVTLKPALLQHSSSAQHMIHTYETRVTSGTPTIIIEMHTYTTPIHTLIPSIDALLPKVEEKERDAVVETTMSKSALKKKKQKAKAKAADTDKPADKAADKSATDSSSSSSASKAPKKKKKEVTIVQIIATIPGATPTSHAYEFISTSDRLKTPMTLFHTSMDFILLHLQSTYGIKMDHTSSIHLFTDRTEWTGVVSSNTMKFMELESRRYAASSPNISDDDIEKMKHSLLKKYNDSMKKESTMAQSVLKQLHASWSLSSLSTFILPYGHTSELLKSWQSIPTNDIQRYLII